MDLKTTMAVSASGLRAQSLRMRVIAENLANATSVSSTPGGDPYRRRLPTFSSEVDRETGAAGVRVNSIQSDQSAFSRVYQPGSPAADARSFTASMKSIPPWSVSQRIASPCAPHPKQ